MIVSFTWRPSRPPLALTSLAHSSYPRWNACPSAPRGPSSDSDAPMTIGSLELPGDVLPAPLPVLPPLPVHPPRTLAAATVMAAAAIALAGNRGRARFTRFLL